MKMSRRFAMTLVLGVFLAGLTNGVAGQKIVLATLDWEPYIGQSLDANGYVAEIVRDAFKRGGYEVEIQFYPWARAIKLAKEGSVDGYFPEYWAEELKAHSLVSEKFPGGPLGFYKRKGDDISYTRLEDLKPYRIGVVRGYVNTAEFDAADYLKKDEAASDLANLKKLLAKRIDLAVADKFVGAYLISQNLPGETGNVEFLSPPLEVKDLYVCISKQTADAQAKLDAFNNGLAQMAEDGSLDAILKKHGF